MSHTNGGAQAAAGPFDVFASLRRGFAVRRPDGGGREICNVLTKALDDALSGLVEEGTPFAVAAVGGYGRREMCLGSDVDIMTVHRVRPKADELAHVLYPMWDAKLTVGHAARTPRDIAAAGRDSVETLSALMTMRFVAGDTVLYETAQQTVAKLVRQQSGRLADVLRSEESARRDQEPYWLLAADVKNGRGGLRALNGVVLEQLRVGDSPPEESGCVADELLDFRNGIHAIAGFGGRRPNDRFLFDLRSQVSEWLGRDMEAAGTELGLARKAAERLADEQWPRLGESADPVAGLGRWVVRALRRPPDLSSSGGFAQAVAALDGPPGGLFSDAEERAIRAATPPLWNAADRSALVRLLAAGRHGRAIVERMDQLGWVSKALPEWAESIDRPHFVPFHAYPVDSHHWSTVDEILRIVEDDDSLLSQVVDELGSVDELLLAGFFHDIGKARVGDHSIVGAQMMADFVGRAHFGATSQRRLPEAVRLHLLLPDAAVRRDIADRAVIGELADQVHDIQLLRLLYLLSIADARSTGPGQLTAWKADLMRQLFGRMEEQLTGRMSELDESAIVRAAGGSHGPGRVAEHLAAMPVGYVDRFSIEEIVRHLTVTTPSPRGDEIRWDAVNARDVTSLVLAALDQPGLLVRVAGTLAARDIAILDARLVTNDAGVGIDTFHIEDAVIGGVVSDRKLSQVRSDLSGMVGYEERLRQRRPRSNLVPSSGQVRTYVDGSASVLEVRTPDRVGLVHDLAAAVTSKGATIHLAKIRTRGALAIDTLWLRDPDTGGPLSDQQVELIAGALRMLVSVPQS